MSDMHGTTAAMRTGVAAGLGSAVLFGLVAPLSKFLLGAADGWVLAGLLYLGAGLGLAAVSAVRRWRRISPSEGALRLRDMPWLVAVVALGGVAGPLLLIFGLARTSAASGSLLLNLEGLATMAIAWLVFRENVDRRLLWGAAAILAGAVLVSFRAGTLGLDMGGVLIAAACLCWGIDNNLTRKLSSADPVQIAMIKGLAAGTVNLLTALALGAALPAPPAMAAALVLGFIGIGLSLVLFMLALRHLGAARTGAYFSLAPFIGAVGALAILGEAPTLQLVLGGLLMGLGVWLHVTERHVHEHEHATVEHEHSHVHDEHHQHPHDGPVVEPHSHLHRHTGLRHSHPHYPDLHHRHSH